MKQMPKSFIAQGSEFTGQAFVTVLNAADMNGVAAIREKLAAPSRNPSTISGVLNRI